MPTAKSATKKRRSPAKHPPNNVVAVREKPFDLPEAMRTHPDLHWDPRITIYCYTEAELKKYVGKPGYSAQFIGPFQVGPYTVREVGAFRDEANPKSRTDYRIVEVKKTD